jgi:hypothetical protein
MCFILLLTKYNILSYSPSTRLLPAFTRLLRIIFTTTPDSRMTTKIRLYEMINKQLNIIITTQYVFYPSLTKYYVFFAFYPPSTRLLPAFYPPFAEYSEK